MSLTEIIKTLCDGKNTTFAGLERDLHLGQGTIRKWDKSSPSIEKLQKVADYFNVSIDYLAGRAQNDFSNLNGVYLNFAKEAQMNDIDPDDIRLALDTIRRLKDK